MRYSEILEAVSPYVDTANFKNWFQGSKVVDQNGKPSAVFHGTFEDFSEFKLESEKRRAYGLNRLGYWFDVDYHTPNYFAGDEREYGNNNVMNVYLSIKKPFILDSEEMDIEDRKILNRARREKRYGEMNAYISSLSNRRLDSYSRLLNSISVRAESHGVKKGSGKFEHYVEQYKRDLIADGHDGICLLDTIADASTRKSNETTWWIAFYPYQIKSVTGNNGNFDPNNNDITK